MQASYVHAVVTGERNYRRLSQADNQRRLLYEPSYVTLLKHAGLICS
jgi:hypothetical protein